MSKLQRLCDEHGQSPWLDNLRRDWIEDGQLAAWVERGVRGVTSNPTIFQKAMSEGHAYDQQLRELVAAGSSIVDAYWEMVIRDIEDALAILRPVYDASGGDDGFVSLELAPDVARDADASTDAARHFHDRIDAPNLFVKIPATAEGIPAVQRTIAAGLNVNITLIFSLERYAEVIDAYLDGLEELTSAGGDVSQVRSVASFFVSRVDTEIDKRLELIGTDDALGLRGRAAIAQAKLAYRLFQQRFSGPRWDALAAHGAKVQRPLWASTSTKNPSYPDTAYVDALIGPDTVNTMPEDTLDAFDDHGTLARTVDDDVEEAEKLFAHLAEIGIELDDVGRVLEEEGVQKFAASFDDLLVTLEEQAAQGS